MDSCVSFFGGCSSRCLVVVAYTLILSVTLAELGVAENSPTNLIGNGNFEDLGGYFPAGVLVRRGGMGRQFLIPHWNVLSRSAPVEIISSLVWQSSYSANQKSLFAVHLNTMAGPGGVQTQFSSPSNSTFSSGIARYLLSVDVAGNPHGGSSLKILEVVVSPSRCRSQKLLVRVARDATSRKLNWVTEHLVLDVHGNPPTVILQFRSLSPGPYGPFIDNVRLVRLRGDIVNETIENDGFCDGYNGENLGNSIPPKSSVGQLLERMWMSAETWIRQRFFRPDDW